MKNLFINIITNLVWKISPTRRKEAFARFAKIEKNSAAQLLACLHYLHEKDDLGAIFNHALEEFSHAHLFAHLAGPSVLAKTPEYSTSSLLQQNGGQESFLRNLAYISVSEGSINHNFDSYQNAISTIQEKQAFASAQDDEDNHADYTKKLLFKLCGSDPIKYSRLILLAKLRRIYENYLHYSHKIGDVTFYFLLSLIYFFVGPLVYLESRKRLALPQRQQSDLLLQELNDQIAVIHKVQL